MARPKAMYAPKPPKQPETPLPTRPSNQFVPARARNPAESLELVERELTLTKLDLRNAMTMLEEWIGYSSSLEVLITEKTGIVFAPPPTQDEVEQQLRERSASQQQQPQPSRPMALPLPEVVADDDDGA